MGKTVIKKKKEDKQPLINNDTEVSKLIKIVIAVVVLFGIFYLITVLVTNKPKKEQTPTEIQYSKIILGNMLKQNETDYYVLLYDEDDSYYELFETYLSQYKGKTGALPYYTSVLDDGFNAQYQGETENLIVSNIAELRVNKTTIFKIVNNQIAEAYSNRDEIENYLKKL